jgi:cysteinyl-tRNA synthetase
MTAYGLLGKLKPSSHSDFAIPELKQRCYAAINDDFNSPILIAELFEAVKIINSVYDGKAAITQDHLDELKKMFSEFVFDILGLKEEASEDQSLNSLLDFVIKLRSEAKNNKDYATSDKIRIGLQQMGIQLKDNKDETIWSKV